LEAYNFVRKFLTETPPEQVRPPRLLGGNDLKALGFAPGPPFKLILEAVEEAQLNGKIRTKEEALQLVQSSFGNK
jgi:hypothetical protein